MLSIQHTYLVQLHNKNATNRTRAAAVYPDAVRAYTSKREYTHFEKSADGKSVSYISFPNDMKSNKEEIDAVLQSSGHLVSDIKPCAIGELTDIDTFYKYNSHLDDEMMKGIEYHLEQDMVFDDVVRNEFDCSRKYEDVFTRNGITLDGKQLRSDIADIEQHGIYVLASKLYQEQGITANEKWLEDNIQPVLIEQYGQELGEKTFSYMNINEDYNELITNHDWSKLNDGPLPLNDYMSMYDEVGSRMTNIDYNHNNQTVLSGINLKSMPSFLNGNVCSSASIKSASSSNNGQLSSNIVDISNEASNDEPEY